METKLTNYEKAQVNSLTKYVKSIEPLYMNSTDMVKLTKEQRKEAQRMIKNATKTNQELLETLLKNHPESMNVI